MEKETSIVDIPPEVFAQLCSKLKKSNTLSLSSSFKYGRNVVNRIRDNAEAKVPNELKAFRDHLTKNVNAPEYNNEDLVITFDIEIQDPQNSYFKSLLPNMAFTSVRIRIEFDKIGDEMRITGVSGTLTNINNPREYCFMFIHTAERPIIRLANDSGAPLNLNKYKLQLWEFLFTHVLMTIQHVRKKGQYALEADSINIHKAFEELVMSLPRPNTNNAVQAPANNRPEVISSTPDISDIEYKQGLTGVLGFTNAKDILIKDAAQPYARYHKIISAINKELTGDYIVKFKTNEVDKQNQYSLAGSSIALERKGNNTFVTASLVINYPAPIGININNIVVDMYHTYNPQTRIGKMHNATGPVCDADEKTLKSQQWRDVVFGRRVLNFEWDFTQPYDMNKMQDFRSPKVTIGDEDGVSGSWKINFKAVQIGMHNALLAKFMHKLTEKYLDPGMKIVDVKQNGVSHEALKNTLNEIVANQPHGGGNKYVKTSVKKLIGGRERVIYKLGRKEYVKMNGMYVSVVDARKTYKTH